MEILVTFHENSAKSFKKLVNDIELGLALLRSRITAAEGGVVVYTPPSILRRLVSAAWTHPKTALMAYRLHF